MRSSRCRFRSPTPACRSACRARAPATPAHSRWASTLLATGNSLSGAPSRSPALGPPGPNPGTTAGIQADNDFCPCGFIVVKSGSTAVATFTFGTTIWSTTGYTTSLGNIASLPGRSLANLTYS